MVHSFAIPPSPTHRISLYSGQCLTVWRWGLEHDARWNPERSSRPSVSRGFRGEGSCLGEGNPYQPEDGWPHVATRSLVRLRAYSDRTGALAESSSVYHTSLSWRMGSHGLIPAFQNCSSCADFFFLPLVRRHSTSANSTSTSRPMSKLAEVEVELSEVEFVANVHQKNDGNWRFENN